MKKNKIKNYWETNSPQTWYSGKKINSKEFFNELEYERYNTYYHYLPKVMEANNHSGEKVLEIGVGQGTDIRRYHKGGAIVYGIDLTKNAIETTQKNIDVPKNRFNVGDAENLPFKDNTFDLVYCFGVLHHTPNTEKAIAEIYRVLKPEGKAIIMLYAVGWKHVLKRCLLRGILLGNFFKHGYQKTINIFTEVNGNSPLTKVYTKRRVKKLFTSFNEVDICKYRLGEYFDYAPYKTRKVWRWIYNILNIFELQKILGENWIIKAKKTTKKNKISFLKTILKP